MEPKKISFGFSKINKKPNLINNKETIKEEPKVELIKCLEGQEIKLIEEKPEVAPLVIPLKENQKTSTALASLMKRRAVLLGEEEPINTTDDHIEDKNNSNIVDVGEDLEKRAARELLAELQQNGTTDVASTLVLPVVKPDDLPLEGAKESNLDDYENIPIQDFGKAMLRGMGWKEPPKTNKKGEPPLDETPMVRPKGMGLGADKALKKKTLLVAPEANEVLEIKRNAYVRILGGKHKDLYGQIEGFDDHAGRVIVKMAIGGNKEAFNEFLCQPISKKEYTQYGKCINTSKYEEYKKKQNEYGQIILNQDERDKIEKSYSIKDEKKVKRERQAYGENEDKYKNHSDSRDDKKYLRKESDLERDYDYNRERETNQKMDKEKYKEKYQRSDNRDDKKYIKKESDRERDYDHKRETVSRGDKEKYDDKYQSRDRDRRERETSRDRDYRKSYRNDNRKDDYKESKRYESRTDSHRDQRERDGQRDYDRLSNKDKQQERHRDSYNDRNPKLDSKVIDIVDSSSESQSDSHSSEHKKSKKAKSSKKKSKKSKKSKSKHKSESSDTESSSSDTESSSNSEEERHRKFKKKTKKSKKQRERSRSRGRR